MAESKEKVVSHRGGTDIQNHAGSSENTDGDDNESDDPIVVSMDPDWENCHPSSCLEPLAADEALPEEERLPTVERETVIFIAGATIVSFRESLQHKDEPV
ncbi:hypothetical protein CAPTEDRAFT_209271 [Capitella teleta]|uniref:Uncharacterized protein n=1 Tax=Capitella teleta TaxID=283909 RepID=R7UEE9_CAPTE|nr:hypothetical protein CAPTEDRAFT_209271 [Capitella teleta]|eukprot:ELU02168.1 hypothetical protein CAPTEDRAFT_209271 [Capitella teleta]